MLKRLLFSWLVNFLGLLVAVQFFPAIQYGDKLRFLVLAALIFGIVNAFIRPLIVILSLPAIVLTFGLFTLVINTFMLYITSFFYPKFDVNSFWQAVGAVVVMWLVNFLMTDLFGKNIEKGKHA